MIFLAVFFVSFSTLAIEILLTRFFSIAQWNHLSFMVISIALFGFALSGTVLCILEMRRQNKQAILLSTTAIGIVTTLFSFTTLLAFIALDRIPLDYFRLSLEPVQLFYLLLAYFLLALPFFFSGLLVALAYTNFPAKTGLVYFASMAGSAGGALAPAFLLPFGGEQKLIVLAALVPLIILPFARTVKIPAGPIVRQHRLITPWLNKVLWAGVVSLCIVLFTVYGSSLIEIRPSPYKALSQIQQFPNTRVVASHPGIRARTDSVETPYIRFAPGLSLKYTDPLPSQHPVFEDADNQFVLYDNGSAEKNHFASHTLSYAGYHLNPRPDRILLILFNGGLSIPCALSSESSDITVLHQNPDIADKIRKHYNLTVFNSHPRRFLAGSGLKYDIIQIENWGVSVPGASALNQEHVFTLESFAAYLQHLTPDGVVVISRKLLLPPSDSIRIWATAYEALKNFDIQDPTEHLAMLRNWDTYTLLITYRPISGAANLTDFAQGHNFDVVFLPGIKAKLANRFNRFKKPFYFLEIGNLAGAYRSGRENDFFHRYFLDVAPQSDNRPFPGRFLKWPQIKRLYQSMGSRANTLIMSGEIVVAIVFIEAFLLSAALLLLPLKLISKNEKKPRWSKILYFGAVGAGFMFIELFFIKRYILFWGNPIISFSVVVSGILIFSSLGGLWSQTRTLDAIRPGILVLIGVLPATFFILEFLGDVILTFSTFCKYIVAMLILMPTGFLMGLPFPLGMRHLLKGPVQRAYGWSVNGCASILAAVASAQIVLGVGIPLLMGCAVISYLMAQAVLVGHSRHAAGIR